MKHDFMSHDLHLPELTLRGMLLGALITVIFTASNVYLGLKVGLTFSSSIPAETARECPSTLPVGSCFPRFQGSCPTDMPPRCLMSL